MAPIGSTVVVMPYLRKDVSQSTIPSCLAMLEYGCVQNVGTLQRFARYVVEACFFFLTTTIWKKKACMKARLLLYKPFFQN